MSKNIALITLLFLLSGSLTVSAGNDDKGLVRKADKAFKRADLGTALQYYKKALAVNPQDAYASFQVGAIYYLTDSSRVKGIPFFENAIKNTPHGQDTIIDAYYYLGNCYILKKDYNKAVESFRVYLSHLVNDRTDKAIIQEVQNSIGLAQSAHAISDRSPDSASYYIMGLYQPVYVKNLGPLVNSPNPEYAEILLNHDSTLIYTSRCPTSQHGKRDYNSGSYFEDIFYCEKDANGQWSLPSLFSNQLHFGPQRYNLASVTLSPDGKTLFVFHEGEVYQSAKTATGWTYPKRLAKNIKQIHKFIPSITISPDGKKLFLVSDKKGGYGGLDLYMSTLNDKGIWSDPANMGPDINTPFNEDGPFMMPDNKTLFFSSKGHGGLGGYDIFKTVYENGKWSKPQNVGAPINSTADDIYFTYDTALKKGYLSSSRIDEGYGDMDIYSFSFNCDNVAKTTLYAQALAGGKPAAAATVSLTEATAQTVLNTTADTSGMFSFELKPDTKYLGTVKAPGFEITNFTMTTPHQCDVYNLYQVLSLKYLGSDTAHTGQQLTLENGFYRTNRPGYSNSRDGHPITALLTSHSEQGDIWFKDTSMQMNYNQTLSDTGKVHAAVAVNNEVKTTPAVQATVPSKFPVVQFNLNKYKIEKEYHPALDSLAKALRANRKLKIQISGYCDATGPITLNMVLSLQRAKAVAAYLRMKGVKAGNIKVEGKGISDPVAPNDGTHNYLNRRAEIVVIK